MVFLVLGVGRRPTNFDIFAALDKGGMWGEACCVFVVGSGACVGVICERMSSCGTLLGLFCSFSVVACRV